MITFYLISNVDNNYDNYNDNNNHSSNGEIQICDLKRIYARVIGQFIQ